MDPSFRPDAIAMIAISSALMLTGAPFDDRLLVCVLRRLVIRLKPLRRQKNVNKAHSTLWLLVLKAVLPWLKPVQTKFPKIRLPTHLLGLTRRCSQAIALQKELVKKVGVEPLSYELVLPNEEIQVAVDAWMKDKIGEDLRKPYPERNEMVSVLRDQFHEAMLEKLGEDYDDLRGEYDEAFTMALHKDVRRGIVEDNLRPDGRKLDEIRVLSSEIGILPRTHGSSLFTRPVLLRE
jgi:polyribonucleotide nucleotidyltransferase